MQVLFIYDLPNYIDLSSFDIIYTLSKYKNYKYFHNNNKVIYLDEDKIISSHRYRLADYFSSFYYSKIINSFIGDRSFFLKKNFNTNFKKIFLIKIKKIILIDYYVKFINLKSKNSVKIFVFCNNISPVLFDKLKSFSFINKNFFIYKKLYLKLLIIENLKFFFSIFFILIFPLIIFLKNFRIKQHKSSYKLGYIINYPQSFDDSGVYAPDFLLKKKLEKNIIFIVDRSTFFLKNEFYNWIKKLNKTRHTFYIEDIYNLKNLINYLLFLPKVLSTAFYFILLISKIRFLAIVLAFEFRSYISWNFFFKNITLKRIFSSMMTGSQSSMIACKSNSISSFLYFGTGERLIKKKNFTEAIDYTTMHFNNYFGSNAAINWTKNNENYIDNYINVGCLPLLFIKSLQNKKNIGIFDNTVGPLGIFNFYEYEIFLSYIFNLIKSYKNFHFIFKTKKNFSFYKENLSTNSLFIFRNLINLKNCTYFDGDNKNVYEILSLSNLVICCPMSSVIYESISSKRNVIVVDINKKYNYTNYSKLHMLSVYNYKQLVKLFELHCLSKKNLIFQKKLIASVNKYDDMCYKDPKLIFKKYLK
jgi:hypothetical protein